MAIAFVGSWTSAQFNNNTGGTLAGRTSTAGNFVAITAESTDLSTFSISHSQAGSVQTARIDTFIAAATVVIDYIENIVGGASHTITLTQAAGTFGALNASEYSGVATSSSLDNTNVGTGTGTSLLSAATATTTQADELLIGGGSTDNGTNSTWSGGASYNLRGNNNTGASGDVNFLEDRIVAATGAYTSSATWSGASGNWICQIATFKAASAVAGEANFLFLPGQFYDTLPGEIRPSEVYVPTFWDDVAAAVASADISVAGILPVGLSFVAGATHDANVSGILPLGATPLATVSHDANVAGILPLGATPVAMVTHDALVAGILPLGAVQVAITRLDVPTIGLLPVGASLVATISHAANVAGILPVGAVPVATISHDATVAGILPVGASLVATVSHNASVAGILPVGTVLVAIVTGATDISVVGVLTVGASLVASVSHTASVAGILPVGTALVAPVSHTTSVAGILPAGLTVVGDVTHRANVVGLLPLGATLFALYTAAGPDSPDLHPIVWIWREAGVLHFTESGLLYVEAKPLEATEEATLRGRDLWITYRETP